MYISNNKNIKLILITILMFLVNIPVVKAEEKIEGADIPNSKPIILETVSKTICDNSTGYAYNVRIPVDKDIRIFYDNRGRIITNGYISIFEESNYNNRSTVTINNMDISYSRAGYYKFNGDSINTSRCYTKVTETGDSQNGTVNVEGKTCGEDSLVSFAKVETKNENNQTVENIEIKDGFEITYENYTDIKIEKKVNKTNGETTLVIKPVSDYLKKNWKNILITSINYDGAGTTHESNLKEKIRDKNGDGRSDEICNEKDLKCTITGIQPNQILLKENSNEIQDGYGSGAFLITFAIKTEYSNSTSTEAEKRDVQICGDYLYLGLINTYIADASSLKLTNTTIKNSAICQKVKNYNKASESLRKNYIYECYDDEILYYEYSSIIAEMYKDNDNDDKTVGIIGDKYNAILNIYDKVNSVSGGLKEIDDLLCTDKNFGLPALGDSTTMPFERKVTYEYSGRYWGMVCIQDYYVESDVPQLVAGGMGVHYDNKVEINKTCYIYKIKEPQQKPKCVVSVYDNICYDPAGHVWGDMTTGGPSEEFDNCVNECDNGTYTQSCINSCYSEVYSSDRKLSISNNDDYSFINKITKTDKNEDGNNCTFNSYNGAECTSSGLKVSISCDPNKWCSINEKNGTCSVYIGGEWKQDICYSAWCQNHDGTSTECTVRWDVGPSGCSWTPAEDLEKEKAAALAEKNDLIELAQKRSEIEKYTIEFTNSNDDFVYSVSGSSDASVDGNIPQLQIIEDTDLSNIETKTSADEKTITVLQRTIYNISLPIQYSLKNNADTILVEGTNKYYTLVKNGNSLCEKNESALCEQFGKNYYKFGEYDYDSDKVVLSNGERVYYTPFDSEINMKIYSSKDTKITCDLTLEELVEQSTTTEYSEGYFLFNNRDYIFYEINETDILQVLAAEEKNINVYFQIAGIDSSDFLNLKNGSQIHNNFVKSDYQCYYGVFNFLKETTVTKEIIEKVLECPCLDDVCEGEDDPEPTPTPTSGGKTTSTGLRYYYREIYLAKNGSVGGVFPNGRNPRWNWTSSASDYSDSSYIVDPIALTEEIEYKGDSIFENESEYDYVFTLTPELINNIREYNDTLVNDKKITYLDFSLVANSKDKINYSQKIKDWFSNDGGLYIKARAITDCNNAVNGTCDNSIKSNNNNSSGEIDWNNGGGN